MVTAGISPTPEEMIAILCRDILLLPRHSRLESSCLHLKKIGT